jgi:nucleoid DNA-binding protein
MSKLHTGDACREVARRTGYDFETIYNIVATFLEVIAASLSSRRDVSLRGFGMFRPVRRTGGGGVVGAKAEDDGGANTVGFVAAEGLKAKIRAAR